MLARYQCPNCSQWHPLAAIPTSMLPAALHVFMREAPAPFNPYEWAAIFAAEMVRRNRGTV